MNQPRKTRGIAIPHLSAWRFAKFMTQRDLAGKSNVSQTSIAQLETGEHTARIATVEKLAAALGISREQLVNDAPNAKAPASDAITNGHASARTSLSTPAQSA